MRQMRRRSIYGHSLTATRLSIRAGTLVPTSPKMESLVTNLDPLSSLALLAASGDRAAVEGLVRGLQGPLYRLALRMLGRTEPARDATQEILVLVVTHLSTFRGESSVKTWAFTIATRHLMRARARVRRFTFEGLEEDDLGKPANEIDPESLAHAEARLLEEETFVGCTQAMLQALEPEARIAFVLGALCDLDAKEAALVLDIPEATFRKRLSRARERLDAFLAKHCGIADPANRCRCAHQVNHNVARKRVDPTRLHYALAHIPSTVEALRARSELGHIRRSLEIYRAQPDFEPTESFAARVRALFDETTSFSMS
ncbi:RNA polymerase sigma-54 factor RpoN [Minicystis rosea]|nr:RNA polymerase sigma-54 factor RpoN [Minicystis rosea]